MNRLRKNTNIKEIDIRFPKILSEQSFPQNVFGYLPTLVAIKIQH